jgi:hypothetical protein
MIQTTESTGTMSTQKKIVDPPEGWRYGFPAELPDNMTLKELFIKHNYPEELRELGYKYSRYWYE